MDSTARLLMDSEQWYSENPREMFVLLIAPTNTVFLLAPGSCPNTLLLRINTRLAPNKLKDLRLFHGFSFPAPQELERATVVGAHPAE